MPEDGFDVALDRLIAAYRDKLPPHEMIMALDLRVLSLERAATRSPQPASSRPNQDPS